MACSEADWRLSATTGYTAQQPWARGTGSGCDGVAAVQPPGERRKLHAGERLLARPPRLCPLFLRVEQVEIGQVGDMRLDRVHGREQPLRHLGPASRIAWRQRLGPVGEVLDDGGALEQHQTGVLDHWNLAPGLDVPVGGRVLVVLAKQLS